MTIFQKIVFSLHHSLFILFLILVLCGMVGWAIIVGLIVLILTEIALNSFSDVPPYAM